METSRKTRTRRRRNVERVSNYAIAYLRVSTGEQAKHGVSLDTQRTAILACAAARGLEIIAWHVDEGVSGKVDPDKRPALSQALSELATGPASVLLFSKLDRLVRSVRYLGVLIEDHVEREGWTMIAADGTVDLSTPQGVAMVQVSGTFSELERKMIGARTREALAEKKAAGVQLGAKRVLPLEVVRRIVDERLAGAGWSAIARGLNADGVLTATGKSWFPNGVRQTYGGQDAARIIAELIEAV